jgi:hypothetical protein
MQVSSRDARKSVWYRLGPLALSAGIVVLLNLPGTAHSFATATLEAHIGFEFTKPAAVQVSFAEMSFTAEGRKGDRLVFKGMLNA